MDLFPLVFPGLEARRRRQLPEPEHFDVSVDPNVPFDELVRRAGFDRVRGLTGLDDPGRPWSEIYPARGGEPYVRRFELLQLCADISEADAWLMVAMMKARQVDAYCEFTEQAAQKRQARGEHLSLGIHEAQAEVARRGYQPADAREFLHFLIQHPHRQRRHYDIAALGAMHQEADRIYVLEVFDRPYQRQNQLIFLMVKSDSFQSFWLSHNRFLASKLVP